MKLLLSSINECKNDKILSNINLQIISESLDSSILQDIAKSIKKNSKERSNSWYYSNKSFKEVFGREEIKWNLVKDSDFEIISADAPEKERKAAEKKVRLVIKSDVHDIVFLRNKSGDFEYFINPWGGVYNILTGQKEGTRSSRKFIDLKQYEKMTYLVNRDIYYLHITNELDNRSLKRERFNNKYGIINSRDEWCLSKIAEENRKRYKDIIAKNKAQKMAEDDNISQDINDLTAEVLEIAKTVNNDMVKYAPLFSEISELLSLLYTKNTSSGIDGLLYSYNKYLYNKKECLTNKSTQFISMYQEDMELHKKNIEKTLEIIYNKLEKIKSQL